MFYEIIVLKVILVVVVATPIELLTVHHYLQYYFQNNMLIIRFNTKFLHDCLQNLLWKVFNINSLKITPYLIFPDRQTMQIYTLHLFGQSWSLIDYRCFPCSLIYSCNSYFLNWQLYCLHKNSLSFDYTNTLESFACSSLVFNCFSENVYIHSGTQTLQQ